MTENDVEFIGNVDMLTGALLGTVRERCLISSFATILYIYTKHLRAFSDAHSSVELKKTHLSFSILFFKGQENS